MPIGSSYADDQFVVVRTTSGFRACKASGVPRGAEVFRAVPCVELTHARCNLLKGSTDDIARWRHPSLPPLVVAVNAAGERLLVPSLEVLPPADAVAWNDAQREAYDRGVEAWRRQGHDRERSFKTTTDTRAELRQLDFSNRKAKIDADADDMIRKAAAKFESMSDLSEVRDAISRITKSCREAEAASRAVPARASVRRLKARLAHVAAQAELRRWRSTADLGRQRERQLLRIEVDGYRGSLQGQRDAADFAALPPHWLVDACNWYRQQARRTGSPTHHAQAEMSLAAIQDRGIAVSYRRT